MDLTSNTPLFLRLASTAVIVMITFTNARWAVGYITLKEASVNHLRNVLVYLIPYTGWVVWTVATGQPNFGGQSAVIAAVVAITFSVGNYYIVKALPEHVQDM